MVMALSGHAQKTVKDSLKNRLEKATTNEEKVDILNELAYQYYDFNDSLALVYAHQALALSLKVNYTSGAQYSYTLVGLGYSSVGNFKEATRYYARADKLTGQNTGGKKIYNLLVWGNIYWYRGHLDSAIILYKKAKSFMLSNDFINLTSYYKNMAQVATQQWQNNKALNYLDSSAYYLNLIGKADRYQTLEIYSVYNEVYQKLYNYDKAKEYLDKMCNTAEKLEDYYHQIKCRVNRSHFQLDQSKFMDALKEAMNALNLGSQYNFPPEYVSLLTTLGEVYVEIGDYDMAADYYYRALKLAEQTGLDERAAFMLNKLAWINKDQGKYAQALDLVNKSQRLYTSINNKKGIADCHNTRGLVYLLMNKLNESIAEHQLALETRQLLEHNEGISASLFNISLVFEARGSFDQALDYQLQSLAIEEKLQNKLGLGISYGALGGLLLKMKQMSRAKHYLDLAKKIGKQINTPLLLRNTSTNLVMYYEMTGDYKQALAAQKDYQVINDSIFSRIGAIKLVEMETQYKVRQREQELQTLQQQQQDQENRIQLQESSIRYRNWIIALGSFSFSLAMIMLGLGYRFYAQKKQANKELHEQKEEIQAQAEELIEANQSLSQMTDTLKEKNEEIHLQSEKLVQANQLLSDINKNLEEKIKSRTEDLRKAFQELDTFFYRSSHDFRRPLTTFMGLAEVAKMTVKDAYALELFEKVNLTAHSLDTMLGKLQSISNLGGQQLEFREVMLKEMVEEIMFGFEDLINQHHIRWTLDVQPGISFYSYPVLVKIILTNLIENAIHFSMFQDPFISINLFAENNHLNIVVKDNGQGIDPAYQSHIFDMYFRANYLSKGNGLGLYIVKKAVEKLEGKIFFESQLGKGTEFKIVLPLRKNVEFA
ncbi:MAG: tetratricopeptide repeat protein [Bacteroidetes bacterium]|nr:tetratricopeptide repeat protein [Bacteroidota bacterium]